MRLGLTHLHLRLPRLGRLRRRTPVGTGFRRTRFWLTGRESLLILAPHCDDETLGSGALIHDAAKKGCQVKVVFMTNGDGFRYAANRQFKRLRIPPQKHREFARMRQRESVRALAALGIKPFQAVFLGYPDRGLQALWNEAWDFAKPYRSPFTGVDHSPYSNSYTPQTPYCGRAVVNDLRALILEQRPTHIVVPHPRDAHGDHTATFCFAMHALEELRNAGFTRPIQVYTYLIHRGTWPQPRGLHPHLELLPPPSFAHLHERWFSLHPSIEALAAKHRAIMQYRSQMGLLGRFLLSFVRKTELFSLYVPTHVRGVPQGTVFVDGKAHEWPEGVGYLPDPVRDTLTRNVERGADVHSIAVCADPGYLYLRIQMHGRVADEVRYTVRLASCSEHRKRITIRLVVPDQVMVRVEHRWVVSSDIICRSSGRVIELAIPRYLIGSGERVILGAETRYRQIMVDRTAWEVLVLPPPGEIESAVLFSSAAKTDLPGIATVFAEAFHGEIVRVLGAEPPSDMMEHLFRLLYETESQALLVARKGSLIVGYIYAPVSLQRIWHEAMVEGHLWRWFTHWVRGRYPISFSAARTLLLDKYFFIRHALRDRERTQHRILSIAVAPHAQGCGIATRLLQQALHRFKRLGVSRVRLEVRPGNASAVHVYRKLGFRACGSMHDSRGEWWIMVKELVPADEEAGTVNSSD